MPAPARIPPADKSRSSSLPPEFRKSCFHSLHAAAQQRSAEAVYNHIFCLRAPALYFRNIHQRTDAGIRIEPYSTRAPDAFIAGAQRSVSSLMNAANSRGDIGVAFEPPAASRSCISLVASARWIAAASLLTIDSGVRAGNATPCQDIDRKPGTVSATVGISGAVNQRSLEVTAIGRTLPPFACPSTVGMLPKVICTTPAMTSAIAGPPPL